MSFTTPPRPFDITALFPQLAPLTRTATRLHPRPGRRACLLTPEQVTEYPNAMELSKELQEQLGD
ncbi:hypothetical protein [Streptomyces sp. NPDC056660]|uniref:hypothetical protein n=1 Tax=Streptomyces sp. NPDC056660 TaxID=3345897 RepID=UPI0036BBCB19